MKKFILFLFVIMSIYHSNTQAQTQTISRQPITADISYAASDGDKKASGTYSVWLSRFHTGIQRPIIIVEGWDPTNEYDESRICTEILNSKK